MAGPYWKNSREGTEKSKKIDSPWGLIDSIKQALSVQRVQEIRKDYFAEANELRGKGELTKIIACRSRKEYMGPFLESLKAATSIGQHIIGKCESDDLFYTQCSSIFFVVGESSKSLRRPRVI